LVNNSADINYIIHESLNGDKKYQEILLKKLHPLIYKNIYKYHNFKEIIVEDLVQESYIIILECLNNYDENHHVHFLGYVKTKLYYFYKNNFRNNYKYRKLMRLNDIQNSELENSRLIEKYDIAQKVIEKEEINELLFNLNLLSKKEQLILKMYYEDDFSIRDISSNLNIPYRTVTSIRYTAIGKLRKVMSVNGGDTNE